MNLNDVNEGIHKYKRIKRLGRGTGSGLGKTSGRGHKGQRSRSGASQPVNFRGGSMPMFRLLPKRGFNNKWALKVGEVNVGDLDARFNDGDEVSMDSLRDKNLAKYRYDILKVLGDGEIGKKLKVSAHRFSKSAREKIEKAGGECIVLPGKKPVVKNKQKSASK
ncbi:MAG: 50S ribosomal protein L15 [Planctomycetota bacterium]